ncbi:hypothetical protein GCM10010104_70670 [Streptomyces indiaensis]|uniref:Uncharacterized protein n=1 Tax=Streptomyces indiaensis TaxID=284033 RepID=A0ABP5RKU5_9ACTN
MAPVGMFGTLPLNLGGVRAAAPGGLPGPAMEVVVLVVLVVSAVLGAGQGRHRALSGAGCRR